MPIAHIDTLFFVIEYLGIFVGALGGALHAARDNHYRFDFIGVLGLGLASALGGGITRDVILQSGPPLAFTNTTYLLTALAGSLAGMLFAAHAGARTARLVMFVDAAGLGLFAIAGSIRAINVGLARLPALLLGVITAVGGGSIRDVLSGRAPHVFMPGELYAIPALLGAGAFLACDAAGFHRTVSTLVGMLMAFALRMLSLRYGWRTRSVRREVRG